MKGPSMTCWGSRFGILARKFASSAIGPAILALHFWQGLDLELWGSGLDGATGSLFMNDTHLLTY